MVEERIRPTFGGHEKFVFRHGWLKKGVDAVLNDPYIFTRDESLVSLGVGKNMVRSIRHWCLATDLLDEKPENGKVKFLKPTQLAEKLLLAGGWDPYLEDTGTLWLLHWHLLSNQKRALVWSLVFSAYFDSEFSKKQLAGLVSKQFEQSGIRTTVGTIDREIDCCLRTYVPGVVKSAGVPVSEESLDCPLAELDLIRHISEENLYRFNIGPKPTLPTAVFGYALLWYLSKLAESRRTVAIEEILYQNGSPGQAFKLDENSLIEYLEQLERQTGGLRMNETAGLRQIYLQDELATEITSRAYELLNIYYGRN